MHLLFALLACTGPEARDGVPSAHLESSGWTAAVAAGGVLSVLDPHGDVVFRDPEALAELAFSPLGDQLVYARRADPGSDLVALSLPPSGGTPAPLVAWPSSEDRPAFSPDGKRLAFVSGRTGIASVYVMELALGSDSARQLTNVDLVRIPGQAPDGFVPPPETAPTWSGDTLSWTAQGRHWSVVP